MADNGKIVDAYAEWDDPHAFRVYLIREGEEIEQSKPMEAVYTGDSIECRLWKAAFIKCAKDMARNSAAERVLGWSKKPAAERVAKAVKADLARIEKGEPAPSNMAMQIALAMVPKSRR